MVNFRRWGKKRRSKRTEDGQGESVYLLAAKELGGDKEEEDSHGGRRDLFEFEIVRIVCRRW